MYKDISKQELHIMSDKQLYKEECFACVSDASNDFYNEIVLRPEEDLCKGHKITSKGKRPPGHQTLEVLRSVQLQKNEHKTAK